MRCELVWSIKETNNYWWLWLLGVYTVRPIETDQSNKVGWFFNILDHVIVVKSTDILFRKNVVLLVPLSRVSLVSKTFLFGTYFLFVWHI